MPQLHSFQTRNTKTFALESMTLYGVDYVGTPEDDALRRVLVAHQGDEFTITIDGKTVRISRLAFETLIKGGVEFLARSAR